MHGADLGLSAPPGVIVADPLLAAGEGGLRRPADASPARGVAAGDFAWVREDIDGQPRAGKLDVGCDQHSDRPVIHRPLTPADVGPSWRRGTTSAAGEGGRS